MIVCLSVFVDLSKNWNEWISFWSGVWSDCECGKLQLLENDHYGLFSITPNGFAFRIIKAHMCLNPNLYMYLSEPGY